MRKIANRQDSFSMHAKIVNKVVCIKGIVVC